jgi:hypothetical protein
MCRTRHRTDGRGTVSQLLRRTLPGTPARYCRRTRKMGRQQLDTGRDARVAAQRRHRQFSFKHFMLARAACMAVAHGEGFQDLRYSRNYSWLSQGTTWTEDAMPGRSRFTSVSCVRRTFCMAVGSGIGFGPQHAEKWNGTRWSRETLPDPQFYPGLTDLLLSDVSCASVSLCMAVGSAFDWGHGRSAGNSTSAQVWNGRRWMEGRAARRPVSSGHRRK